MTHAIRLRRLRRLEKCLGRKMKHEFNMGVWWCGNFSKPTIDCGTSACAGGTYILMEKPRCLKLEKQLWPVFVPIYRTKNKKLTWYDALAAHFGITYDESKLIFSAVAYRGTIKNIFAIRPHHVAARVRKLIRQYQKAGK